jgi:hypothetical protein
VLAIVLAFWGIFIPQTQTGGDRIYLLDVSASFQGHLPQALEFIRQNASTLSPYDRTSVIVFGKKPLVEIDLGNPSKAAQIQQIHSLISPENTNLQAALEFAITFQQKGRDFQIILLSDGKETVGNALKWASLHSSCVYVKTFSHPESDFKIQQIQAPLEVQKDEYFLIRLYLQGKRDLSTTLYLTAPGVSQTKKIFFAQTEEEILFSLSLSKEGFYPFQIEMPQRRAEIVGNEFIKFRQLFFRLLVF